MNNTDLKYLAGEVCELARTAGAFINNAAGKLSEGDIKSKGLHDFVTHIDKEAERKLVKGLSKLLPGAGYMTEENTANCKGHRYDWIVDPLDGTTNFIHSVPLFSVSIALKENDELALGVVHEVNLDETFYAWKEAPAMLNGKEIHVSKTAKLADSLLATGFPNRDYGRLNEFMALLNDLIFDTHGIRRLGSAAVDLAWVACGRFECFYEYGLNQWDVAAGALIVQNAGGSVSDFEGGDNYLAGKDIIASNTLIHEEFLQKLKHHFFNAK